MGGAGGGGRADIYQLSLSTFGTQRSVVGVSHPIVGTCQPSRVISGASLMRSLGLSEVEGVPRSPLH